MKMKNRRQRLLQSLLFCRWAQLVLWRRSEEDAVINRIEKFIEPDRSQELSGI